MVLNLVPFDAKSVFVQVVLFCAYVLLRDNERKQIKRKDLRVEQIWATILRKLARSNVVRELYFRCFVLLVRKVAKTIFSATVPTHSAKFDPFTFLVFGWIVFWYDQTKCGRARKNTDH